MAAFGDVAAVHVAALSNGDIVGLARDCCSCWSRKKGTERRFVWDDALEICAEAFFRENGRRGFGIGGCAVDRETIVFGDDARRCGAGVWDGLRI